VSGACPIDEDPAHGLGGGGKEVGPIRELHSRRITASRQQAQVRLMRKRCGVKSLSGPFVGKHSRGKLAQIVVNQRQELVKRATIASFHGAAEGRDLVFANVSHGINSGWQGARLEKAGKASTREPVLRTPTFLYRLHAFGASAGL
jgi:hypothetical protein